MRTKNIIITLLSSMLFVSCNYLDFDETNGLKQKEDMYKYFGTVEQMLTHVYSFMPQDFGTIGGAMRDCASDDAEFGAIGADIQIFNNGNWSPIKTPDTSWYLYEGIRAANSFIAEIANVDFSRYEHDGGYVNQMKKLKYYPYEARVLRAHYFFELARRYGDIAMPLTVLTTEEANQISKTPFAQVIQFIADECSECALNLPKNYTKEPGTQIGRVTQGFALAVKSKALLYAASPLNNPSMNPELWKKSAKAALELINLGESGEYTLDPNGVANSTTSKEIVLMRMNAENTNFELYNFPIRYTLGKRPSATIDYSTFPSQNLVDAFETKDGYPVTLGANGWISSDPNFQPQKPYNNRDKRFERTILANGMFLKGATDPDGAIQTFVGGKDYLPVSQGGTPTGYYLFKYIQPTTSFVPDKEVKNKHHWVIYRYAEAWLTYAESMFYAFQDKGIDYSEPDEYKYSALSAINKVRANAGMPDIKAGISNEEFEQKLRNEWRVEFAFEDHRFWDVRRWKIAADTQRELYGVKIEKVDNKLQFSRKLYETRVWKNCMYWYPIPQAELYKNLNLNPQNPEW